jgi:hypothetical protein
MIKLCELCRIHPAEIPDRNRMGRPVKRICTACHFERLREDLAYILCANNRKVNNECHEIEKKGG